MLKKIFIFILLNTLFYSTSSANNFIENIFNWKKIRVLEYEIWQNDYILKVWANENFNATSLRELMEKNNWVSAINWVFFCPADYRECWKQDFTRNERYLEGIKFGSEYSTWDRVVFAWDKETKPFLFQTDKINKEKENDIFYWLSNYPLILQAWENKVPEYQEKWLLVANMKTKWTRNFICSTEDKTKIYTWLVYDISLLDLWEYLRSFWCYDALNLDAWATTAMIYNGRYLAWPGRKLLDAVIFERKWLDIKKLNELTENVKVSLKEKLQDFSTENKIIFLEKFLKAFQNFRTKTYDYNSIDLFDSEGKKTGYKVFWNNLKVVSDMYLVNKITIILNDFLKEAKAEKKTEEQNEKLLF